jgi:hypothetical protein
MAETLIQTFLGNVGIGTDDPGSYKLKVNNSESSNVGPLEVSSLSINGTDNVQIPQYFIAFWYGSQDNIPEGWILCSGNSGTSDFRNKFIRGTTSGAFNGGGNHNLTLALDWMPEHSHDSGTTGTESANHNHTLSGSHYHRQNASDDGGRNDGTTCQAAVYYGQNGMGMYGKNTGVSINGNNANHTHTGTTNSIGSGTSFSVMPPYRSLCVIMKL